MVHPYRAGEFGPWKKMKIQLLPVKYQWIFPSNNCKCYRSMTEYMVALEPNLAHFWIGTAWTIISLQISWNLHKVTKIQHEILKFGFSIIIKPMNHHKTQNNCEESWEKFWMGKNDIFSEQSESNSKGEIESVNLF